MAKVAAEAGSTANRYQILAKLASGGMAEIFLARAVSLAGVERYCVLKRILGERADDADAIQMFVDEARLAAQLHHPNIASVYDVGVVGDSYFFTMEYVHGETVRALLQRAYEQQRSLPLACVLTIMAGAAAGLHHAHERKAHDGRPLGIVHRDVSPSNLMVSFEGHVKLVDFGVAKAAGRATETRAGTVKGKISYLSPEQCRTLPVDRRSDLFSLGIVMWEMLTCTRLYRRATDFENMVAIVGDPTPAPSSIRPEVPRAVDAIVLRLLAKSPDDRFQTAGEVVEAIEDASLGAGTILSSSAVSRLLHDLFGTRAEPWLDLDPDAELHDTATELSVPIPTADAGTPSNPLEIALAAAPDLAAESARVKTSPGVAMPGFGTGSPRRQTATSAATPAAVRSGTSGVRQADSLIPTVTERDRPHDAVDDVDEDSDSSVSGLVVTELYAGGAPTPSGVLLVGPSPVVSGAAEPDLATAPRPRPLPAPAAAPPPLPPVSRRRVAVIATVGVAVTLAAWLALRSEATGTAATAKAVEPPSVVEEPAATAPGPGSASAVANSPAPAAPPPAPAPASFEALSERYEQHDYPAVLAGCAASASTTGITTICLMAACRSGDAVQALRWLRAVPSSRHAELVAHCAQIGNLDAAAIATLRAAAAPPAATQSKAAPIETRGGTPSEPPHAPRAPDPAPAPTRHEAVAPRRDAPAPPATLDCANNPLDCR